MLHNSFRRFTGHLAKAAQHVTAVEFMETFLNENKKRNRSYDNITFILNDVTSLEMQPNRFVLHCKHTDIKVFKKNKISLFLLANTFLPKY